MLRVLALATVLAACGQKSEVVKGPPPAPAGPQPTYAQVAPLVAKNCGGCHKPGSSLPQLGTEAQLRASKAKTELSEGGMPPPPKTISAGDKAALLSFLGG